MRESWLSVSLTRLVECKQCQGAAASLVSCDFCLACSSTTRALLKVNITAVLLSVATERTMMLNHIAGTISDKPCRIQGQHNLL